MHAYLVLLWQLFMQGEGGTPAPVSPVNPYTPMGPGRGRERRVVAALFAQRMIDEDGD